MAFNQSGYTPPEKLYKTPFTDVNPGIYFAPYIKKALEMGIISFNPEVPIFLPASPINRLEAIKIIIEIKGIPTPYVSENTESIFSDIQNDRSDFNIIHSAEKSGVYLTDNFPMFLPGRSLKRGEAAELIYKANQYSQSLNFIPTHYSTNPDETNIPSNLSLNSKFPLFLNVWDKIHQDFIHNDEIDDTKLVYGAINGMVQSLKDPYSVYKNPDEAKDLTQAIEGNYEGIGIALDVFENQFIIISVFEGSPALEAGLEPGDIIEKIDQKAVKGYSIEEVITAIKGPSGTKVNMTIKRDGQSISKEITRKNIVMDTVLLQAKTVEIPESMGYISIQQFTESTGREFDAVLNQILAGDPKGLIIDLRDNPGGYVSSVHEVLSRFVPRGKTINNIQIGNMIIEQYSDGDGKLENMPLVVLINDRTASSAEIMAGALQDYKIGKLVGVTTFGKGTVQEVNVYNDGSLLKLSIAKWLTPLLQDVDKKGLFPDIVVKETKDDVIGDGDTQLAGAIAELAKLI